MSKFPEDLRVYEHLLWLDGPDTVLELGTQWGGSALWFRDRLTTMRAYGPNCGQPDCGDRGHLPDRVASHARAVRHAAGIELVEGDLGDPETGERVASLIGDRCFVVKDSAHTYETTRAALEKYARLCRPAASW